MVILLFRKKVNRQIKEAIGLENQLDSLLIESVDTIETIKSLGSEQVFVEKFKTAFAKCLEQGILYVKVIEKENFLIRLISTAGGIAVLWLGIHNVMIGTLSFGAFLTFDALLVFFLRPAQELIELQASLQTTWINFCRMHEMIELPTEKSLGGSKNLSSLLVPIEMKNISFRYGSRRLTLLDLSLRIEPGEKVAIVGRSGAGKSTISKLLLGFYFPEAGEIFWGEDEVRQLDVSSLRQKIAYVPQDVALFRGSIEENLKQKNQDVPEFEFRRICKICGVDEFVEELPGRYQFKITHQGGNFSNGQRQRLALARAIMKRPDVIILDEATSNVDTITENRIVKMLLDELRESTVIMIAHRLSMAQNCQKIIVIDGGKVIGEGTDLQLRESCALYRELWASYRKS